MNEKDVNTAVARLVNSKNTVSNIFSDLKTVIYKSPTNAIANKIVIKLFTSSHAFFIVSTPSLYYMQKIRH